MRALTASISLTERWSRFRRGAAGAGGGSSCFLADGLAAGGEAFLAVVAEGGETPATGVAVPDLSRLALGGLPDASDDRRLPEAGEFTVSPGLGVLSAVERGDALVPDFGLPPVRAEGLAAGFTDALGFFA